MNAFLCLALLALGAVPVVLTLLAINKTLVVLLPTVPLCFHPSGLGTLASVVLVSSIALQLGSRSCFRSSHAGLQFAGVQRRWPQSHLGPVVAGL